MTTDYTGQHKSVTDGIITVWHCFQITLNLYTTVFVILKREVDKNKFTNAVNTFLKNPATKKTNKQTDNTKKVTTVNIYYKNNVIIIN